MKCAWCDNEATGEIKTQRALIRSVKGIKTVVEAARYAPACAEHHRVKASEEPTVVRARRAGRAKGWKNRQASIFD